MHTGDISAGGYVGVSGTLIGDISSGSDVGSWHMHTGDISAGGDVGVYGDGTVTGDISAKGAITTQNNGKIYGKQSQNLSDFEFTVDKMLATYQNNGTKYIATRSVLGLMMLCGADVIAGTDGVSIIDVLKQMHIAVQNINGYAQNTSANDAAAANAQAALAAITANNLLSKSTPAVRRIWCDQTAIEGLVQTTWPSDTTALKTLQQI